MPEVARLQALVTADVAGAMRDLDAFGGKLGGLGNIAGLAGKAVAVGIAAAGAGVTAAVGLGIKGAGDLQQAVANISTIKPDIDTSAVFASLNDLSTKVPQTAGQMGDALYNVFSSIETTQSGALALVEKFAKGAVGAQTDAQTFGTSVMGVMNAYGLAVEDADHISDVFFNTVNKGVVTGDELAQNLGLVTQSAKMAGVPLDTLGGFLAGVTKEGGPASQNINNLNNFLLKVTTKDAQKALNDMGIATVDAAGKFRAMPDVLTDLKGHLETLSEAEKTAALQDIFPDLQARAGASVLISQLDFVKGAIDENINSSGAASAAFAKMNATFNSQMQILGNTFKSILTTFGAEILPVITPIIVAFAQQLPSAFAAFRATVEPVIAVIKDSFGTLVQVFQGEWAPDAAQIQPFTNAVGQAGLIVRDVLLPAVMSMIDFMSGHTEIIVGFGAALLALAAAAAIAATIVAIGGAIAFLISPIGLIVVAIGVLTAAWVGNWGDIQGKTAAVVSWLQGVPGMLSGAWTAIQNGWKQLFTAASATWTGIQTTISTFIANAQRTIQTFLTTVQAAWTAGWNAITAFITSAMQIIGTIFTIALGLWYVLFVEKWVALFQITQEIWNQISAWFMSWWTPLIEFLALKLTEIWTAISTAWTLISTTTMEIWTAISTWFMEVFWNPLVAFMTAILTTIGTLITTAWTLIQTKTTEIWTAISTWFMNTFWNPLLAFVTETTAKIATEIETKWNAINAKAIEIWDAIKADILGRWNLMYSDAETQVNKIRDYVTGTFEDLAGKAKSWATEMLGNFLDGLKEKGESILNWVGSFIKSISDKISSAGDEDSPSKLMFEHGANFGEGFRLGLESKLDAVRATAAAMVGAATPQGGALTAGGPYVDFARQAAERWGVPPDMFVRQIQQESGFQAHVTSSAGAQGIAQFVPGTAAAYGVNVADPYSSLEGAAHHMADLFRQFGSWELALAAYNAGPGAVQQYGGVPPYAETQHYIRTILGRARGGPIGANMDYLVGERGPELFRSSRRGRIDPLEDVTSGRSGGTHITIQVNAPVYGVDHMEAVVLKALDRADARGRRYGR